MKRQPKAIDHAKQYVQDLCKHVGNPTRIQHTTVIVGTRRNPHTPLTVVALTAAGNQSETRDVMMQIASKTINLANSLAKNPTLPHDIKGWRHKPQPLTVKTIMDGAKLTTVSTAAFNIMLNSLQAPDSANATIAGASIIGVAAILITTLGCRVQSDIEKQKAQELIYRIDSFNAPNAPDVDCFTGQPDNGVYAGIVSIEVCRQMAHATKPKLW